MKYDEKLVDELLSQLDGWESSLPPGANRAVAALKPKPAKFYIMPEWDEFCKGKYVSAGGLARYDGSYFTKEDYNIYREATATDKPMVHIPAGSEWSNDDMDSIRRIYSETVGVDAGLREVIDAIKNKLEPKP